jgi:hypothetical protein
VLHNLRNDPNGIMAAYKGSDTNGWIHGCNSLQYWLIVLRDTLIIAVDLREGSKQFCALLVGSCGEEEESRARLESAS